MQVVSEAPLLGAEAQRFIRWGGTAWGEGEAFLARDRLSGLPVAWQAFSKVPASAWHRYRTLVRPLSRSVHPGLARVVDCGREERSTWVAEEWIPGTQPLDDRWASDPVTFPRLREVLIHCALALGALHRSGIVHGALSPRSLRVAASDGRIQHAWIIGSGLWLLGEARTRARITPFLAPEVVAGGDPTVQSDIFGLGQSLLALAGAGNAESDAGAPEGRPMLGAPLSGLLASMVAPDPAARPQDFARVVDLAQALPHAPRVLRRTSDRPAAPPLVGRARELAFAAEVLGRAARGDGHALEVRGPSGSGKSAFLRAVATTAREQGFVVVALDLRSGSAPDPEAALAQALARALSFTRPADRPPVAHPESRASRFATTLGGAIDRSGRPCCVILDPAAGSAAEVLPFLRALVRALGQRPFLACLARTEPAHLPSSAEIVLDPLDRRAVEQLLSPWAIERANALAIAPALRDRTGGWPLALELAMAAGIDLEPGAEMESSDELEGTPSEPDSEADPGVALVEQALSRLDPAARECAELLALWDGMLPAGIAHRLWPETDLATRLPGWLVARTEAGDLGLASEVGRQALRDGLPSHRLRAGHARLLDALGVDASDSSQRPAVLATHAIGAGEAERGARAALAAARAARAAGRASAALQHYRQALAASAAAPAAIDWASSALEAAEHAIGMGEWLAAHEALAASDRAQEFAPIATPLQFAALLARAQVLRERRLLGDARAACAAARELAARAPAALGPAAAARVELEAAAIDFAAGEGPAGEERLAHVLPQLAAAGRYDLLPVAWNRLATLRSLAGEPADALRLALTAARRARRIGAAEVQIRSLVNAAFFAFQLDRRRQAFRLLDRARALLVHTPHAGLWVSELVHRAELLALERRFAEAESALVEARAVRLESGGRSRLPAILITLGNLRARSGRLRAAAAAYEEAIALAEELGTPEVHSARGNFGALLVRMGEEREGERLIRRGLADPRPDRRALGLLNLTALLRRRGRTGEAAAALAEALAALEGRNPVGERRARVEGARLRLAASDPQGALTELSALGAPDPGDPAGAAEEHWTAALARTATGRDAHSAWGRALASAELAADPTLHAEILIEALHWAQSGPEELAARPDAIGRWSDALAGAARMTDAPPIAQAVRALARVARSPDANRAPAAVLAARLSALARESGRHDSFAARLERELAPWGARGAVIVALDLDPGSGQEPAAGPRAPSVRPYRAALRAFDRELFRAALARTGGQVPAAARLLRLPESTFRYRAGKAGVLRPRTIEPKPDS